MPKLMLLVILLLAACSSASPTGSPAPGTPPPSPGSTAPAPTDPAPTAPAAADWRVLADDLWLAQAPFAVTAALSQDELTALWQQLDRDGPPPAVDFEREAVLFMGMSGSSSCPETLSGLVVDHANAVVFGEWTQQVPPGGACTDDLGGQGLLIAVDRSVLPDQTFLLSLRQAPICGDCAEQPDRLFVDPAR